MVKIINKNTTIVTTSETSFDTTNIQDIQIIIDELTKLKDDKSIDAITIGINVWCRKTMGDRKL